MKNEENREDSREKKPEVTSKSYTLRNKTGQWLGQVVLTSDGMFASVTDWGNLSYAWRSFGTDFREFILNLSPDYFGTKMFTGMAYILHSRKCEAACNRFAKEILPALQQALLDEIEAETANLQLTTEN